MANNMNDVRMAANQALLQKTGKTQAAFVPKLYLMVKDMRQPTPEDPNPERPLISWCKAGDVFCVFDPIEFSRVILPLHFKHNNWQSFVRQLNMYGFHKVNDLLSSSYCHPDTAQAWEFRHPNFKRDRPDLLPMIKRKSTKHHGSSKAAQVKLQAPSQARETRLYHQTTPDGASSRAGRPFHVYAPYNHPGSALPMAHRSLHGKPPPPPPLHISKVDALPQMPTPPPALHPHITHQIQYPHASHRKVKSFSPPIKPANAKGTSSTATTNTCNTSLMLSSPGSARPTSHHFHPIQPTQAIPHNVQEDKFTHRTIVEAWRSKPESHQSNSTLSRVEDELRRLNDILSHRDLIGNHVFSVLGLLVELVNLLVNDKRDKNLPDSPDQQQMLSHYAQAAKVAMSKLQHVSHEYQDAGRKCDGVSSTDSVSPASTDRTVPERPVIYSKQMQRNSIDSNLKIIGGPVSPTRAARPRCPDRLNSSQSLPPLRTIMESWAPPIINRTHSSGPLPASINRLMNVDSHDHSTTEMSSVSDENACEEHTDDHHDDRAPEDYDDFVQDDSDGLDDSDGDDHTEGDDQLQEDERSDEYDVNENDDCGYEETRGHSADGPRSASYHRSDVSQSPPENAASESGNGFELDCLRDRSALIPFKRSSAQYASIVLSSNDSAEEEATPQHPNAIHSSWKRTRLV